MITVAVVGAGGWGKNLARNYYEIPDSRLKYICDLNKSRLASLAVQLPGTTMTSELDDVLADPDVQGVVVATPAPLHYAICQRALERGKDVYVEKPFVLEVDHAEQLIELARRKERVLMVGHLLEYHPVINHLRQMIQNNELGDIYYIYTQRLNLGTVRKDENALWNFAPHDVSSILYLLNQEPTDVSARGQCYLQRGVEDVVFMTLNFSDKSMAHIHVSWLDPHKVRKLIIVGSKKMAVFDDVDSTEKLRIYDKGAAAQTEYSSFAEYVGLRFGDVVIPYVKVAEPLRLECQHFLECIRTRQKPRSDGYDGLRVIKVLDGAQRSIRKNSAPVSLLAEKLDLTLSA